MSEHEVNEGNRRDDGLPIVQWEHVNKYTGDCWGGLVRLSDAEAQLSTLRAEVERLKASAQEKALQYLSDNGQWLEETSTLRDQVTRLARENEAMREAGALMANTMFNLAQQTHKFDGYHCKLFKSMQVKWDAARAALHSALKKGTP